MTKEVDFNNAQEQAILLLAAADDLGLDQSVVATSTGKFIVPDEVYEKAYGKSKASAKKTSKKK